MALSHLTVVRDEGEWLNECCDTRLLTVERAASKSLSPPRKFDDASL